MVLDIALGIVSGVILLYVLYLLSALILGILRASWEAFWEVLEAIPAEASEFWKIAKFDAAWIYRRFFWAGKVAGRAWGRLKGNV